MIRLAFWGFALFLFSALQAAGGPTDSLTLSDAVREALENNLSLAAERYNLSIADARIITARLRPNPVLSLGTDHLDALGTGYSTENNAGPAEYSLRTDFLFERGQKRANRIAVAESSKSLAQLQLLNVVRGILLDVQSGFVDVLLAKANVALAHESLEAFRGIVRVNEQRVKAGDLAEVELLRAQLAELQFENAVNQAELRETTARARLQVLIGRKKEARPFDVAGELRREELTGVTVNDLQEEARTRRPDIRAAQQDQARSLAEVRLQLAQGKVDYTVGSEYRRQQGLAGRGNSLGFFVQTNLPVFNRNQGEIERARQEQKQIEARLRALEVQVENEVQVAFLQYSTARRTLDRIESTMLKRARDVRQITQYSYTRGEASLIEFLDAQRAYNDTIQTYNDARAEYARSLYQIDAATGKGVQ